MSKSRVFALASLVLLACAMPLHAAEPAASTEGEDPFLGGFLRETRMIYPLRVGDWEAQGEHLFDVQALGASVRYQHAKHQDRWIDMYFYPAGALPRAGFDDAVSRTVAEIETAATQNVGRKGFAIDRTVAFTIVLDPDNELEELRSVAGKSVSLRYLNNARTYNSSMAMAVHDLYFIKARYSVEEPAMARSALRKTTEEFLGDMARSVKIVSTGGCWMPLPIRKIEAGSASPTDMQGTFSDGGKPAAYVHQDHIAAYDPDGPVAKVAMIVTMRENGRLFWGCIAPEDMNQSVPDGMREIRIEYRAPEESGQSRPSRRPNSRKAGLNPPYKHRGV